MANDKFSIKDSLAYGWDSFKARPGFFIGFTLILGAIVGIPNVIIDRTLNHDSILYAVLTLLDRILGLVMGMAATRISLDIYDEGAPNLSRLSELVPLLPSYLGGKILYGLAIALGLVLLVVPGCIWAYMFLYVGYLIIDRQLGPIEAFHESRAITYGYKWDLALFSFVMGLINILGMALLLLGLFITIPVTLMASAYVYRRLSPQAAALVTP